MPRAPITIEQHYLFGRAYKDFLRQLEIIETGNKTGRGAMRMSKDSQLGRALEQLHLAMHQVARAMTGEVRQLIPEGRKGWIPDNFYITHGDALTGIVD
jgi:hypothetical protein